MDETEILMQVHVHEEYIKNCLLVYISLILSISISKVYLN